MSDVITNHHKACSGFSDIVAQGEGRWARPSPCAEWDARGVVEHVIGFHIALLLEPTGSRVTLPKDDPTARWAMTAAAIDAGMEAAASSEPPAVDLEQLLPGLTSEVLTHTWDLATAIGVEPHLDAELCAVSYDFMRGNVDQIRSSGMFGAAVSAPDRSDPRTQLIAFLGRNPDWTP